MIRRLVLAAVAAAALVVPVGMAASASAATTAPAVAVRPAAPPPPCAAGYSQIIDEATGQGIAGNGVNNEVSLASPGNCFTAIAEGDGYYCYQNGYGNELWADGSSLDLGGSGCASGHTNENMLGVNDSGGYWTIKNQTNGWFWDTVQDGCPADDIFVGLITSENTGTCDRFKP